MKKAALLVLGVALLAAAVWFVVGRTDDAAERGRSAPASASASRSDADPLVALDTESATDAKREALSFHASSDGRGPIQGRVITREQQAIAGVEVFLLKMTGRDEEKDSTELGRTASGADGSFAFGAPTDQAGLFVLVQPENVQGPDGQRFRETIAEVHPNRETIVVLEPASWEVVVVGRVVDTASNELIPQFEVRDDERFVTRTATNIKERWLTVPQTVEGFRTELLRPSMDESSEHFHLAIRARGFLGQVVELSFAKGEVVDAGVIQLAPAQECSGIVVDSSDHPIGGAHVSAIVKHGDGSLGSSRDEARTRDDDGSFVLPFSRGVEVDSLYVTGGEHAPRLVRGADVGGVWTGIVIRLGEGGRIDGQVVHAGGQPVEKAFVSAWLENVVSHELPAGTMGCSTWCKRAKLDGDGIFHLQRVPSGRIGVAVCFPGDGVDPIVRQLRSVDVTEGSGATCDFRIGDGCEVRGAIEFPRQLFGRDEYRLYLELRTGDGDDARTIAATPARAGNPFLIEDVPVDPEGADLVLRMSAAPGFYAERKVRIDGPRTEVGVFRFVTWEKLAEFNRGERQIFEMRKK